MKMAPCGASKNFCQLVSTSAGPRRGLSASQMTSGAIMLVKVFTSRSASVFANAISVARTCSVNAASDSSAALFALAGTATTLQQAQGHENANLHGFLPTTEAADYYLRERGLPLFRWHNARMKSRDLGEFTTLMARDGHEFNAWLAAPSGQARGAVVIAQEIFGVNRHIRAVADSYAAAGYVTIAPCLFDRIRRGIELGYSEKETQEGRGYRMQIPKEKTLVDLNSSINVIKHAGRVAVIGYCWGGTLAYLAACELPVACAVSYYGGQIKDHLAKSPRRPVMYHFGEKDPYIPPSDIEKIRAADPNGVFHLYPADHGFNCEERGSYDAASAQLARERTLEFLARKMNTKMESK